MQKWLPVYKLSSDNEHSNAQFNLAVIYNQGKDVPRDFKKKPFFIIIKQREMAIQELFIFSVLFISKESIYYGKKIENQTRKEKIKEIDNRTVINSSFYEAFDDVK